MTTGLLNLRTTTKKNNPVMMGKTGDVAAGPTGAGVCFVITAV
jgi:hypothetical protein